MCLLANHAGDVFQHFFQTKIGILHIQLAGLDLGEIQNVVNDADEGLGGRLCFRDVVTLLGCQVRLQREMGHAENRIHRRADLVTGVGKEFRFRLCSRFGYFFGSDEFRLQSLAFRNIFLQGGHILRSALRVPEQKKSHACDDDTAVPANQALFPLILFAFPMDQLSISFRARGALIRMRNLVPPLQAAKLFLGVTQHLLQRTVGENFPCGNPVEADPNLCILENRTEEPITCLLLLFDDGC